MEVKYDQLSFVSKAAPERHIDRLFVLTQLAEFPSCPPEKSRVLEIGCSTGANLIPQAIRYPESEFTGIDLSEVQIKEGRKAIDELKLKNIQLIRDDFRSYDRKLKKFNYIIVHGLFSWIDKALQEELLDFIASALSEDGACYLSYNVLPGWQSRLEIKDLLLSEIDTEQPLLNAAEQARIFLRELTETFFDGKSNYSDGFIAEVEACLSQSDAFIAHELLNKDASAEMLADLQSRAKQHGLKYLVEADLKRMRSLKYDCSGGVCEQRDLTRIKGDLAEVEGELDLLYPLAFRGSIFVPLRSKVKFHFSKNSIKNSFLSSPLVPFKDPINLHEHIDELFCGPEDLKLKIAEPALKAILLNLRSNWPEAVSFEELSEHVKLMLGEGIDCCGDTLIALMLPLIKSSLVYVHGAQLGASSNVSQKPEVSPFARFQARESNTVFNMRHEYTELALLDQKLITFVDGLRSREDLAKELLNLVKQGVFTPVEEGEKVYDEARLQKLCREQVDASLAYFAEQALLLSEQSNNPSCALRSFCMTDDENTDSSLNSKESVKQTLGDLLCGLKESPLYTFLEHMKLVELMQECVDDIEELKEKSFGDLVNLGARGIIDIKNISLEQTKAISAKLGKLLESEVGAAEDELTQSGFCFNKQQAKRAEFPQRDDIPVYSSVVAERLLEDIISRIRTAANFKALRFKKLESFWDASIVRAPFIEMLTFGELATMSATVLLKKRSFGNAKIHALIKAVEKALGTVNDTDDCSDNECNLSSLQASEAVTEKVTYKWKLKKVTSPVLQSFISLVEKESVAAKRSTAPLAMLLNKLSEIDDADLVLSDLIMGDPVVLSLVATGEDSDKSRADDLLLELAREYCAELVTAWQALLSSAGVPETQLFDPFIDLNFSIELQKLLGRSLLKLMGASHPCAYGYKHIGYWTIVEKSLKINLDAAMGDLPQSDEEFRAALVSLLPLFNVEELLSSLAKQIIFNKESGYWQALS